jgi:hypothetical protein
MGKNTWYYIIIIICLIASTYLIFSMVTSEGDKESCIRLGYITNFKDFACIDSNAKLHYFIIQEDFFYGMIPYSKLNMTIINKD